MLSVPGTSGASSRSPSTSPQKDGGGLRNYGLDQLPQNDTVPDEIKFGSATMIKTGYFGKGVHAECFEYSSNSCLKSRHAVKVFRRELNQAKRITEVGLYKSTYLGAKLHKGLNHINISRCKGIWKNKEFVFYSQQPYYHGNLKMLLRRRKGKLMEMEKRYFIQDVARGLRYLHEDKYIVHRNIKTSNLLVDYLGRVKISDFEFARSLNILCGWIDEPLRKNFDFPPFEVVTGGKKAYFSFDTWCLGNVLYELSTGDVPRCSGNLNDSSYSVIITELINSVRSIGDAQYAHLLCKELWRKDHNKRIKMSKVLEHRFITMTPAIPELIGASPFMGSEKIARLANEEEGPVHEEPRVPLEPVGAEAEATAPGFLYACLGGCTQGDKPTSR